MFGALAFVLLSLSAPAREWAPILALTLVLGGLYWRWSYLSNQLRDVWIRDYVLSDAVVLCISGTTVDCLRRVRFMFLEFAMLSNSNSV